MAGEATDTEAAAVTRGDGRKARSGSETRRRGVPMAIRATRAERDEIEAAAAAAGQEVGAYLRARALAPPERSGSGVAPESRPNTIPFRATEAERTLIEEAARQHGLSAGAYVRARALKHPVTLSRGAPTVEKEALARLLGLIGLYGSNLNQLAYVANAERVLPTAAALKEIARHVRQMRDEQMRALGKRV